ncbi:ATP-dependent Clp protease ClpS [Planctomycetia bacterium]|jgi:ATP-dependent Clp protease adaptor protein ClpS|nr:ATP-dependent Clp protease ClpS [Planctomycetia bacterium]
MPDSASAAVAEPTTTVPVAQPREKPRRQPRYHVILWNDDDHSYHYVMAMLKQLFGHPHERGFKLAEQVDRSGRAIVLTTTKEHAELKRDQIHAFGADRLVARCKGSMKASIEAEG